MQHSFLGHGAAYLLSWVPSVGLYVFHVSGPYSTNFFNYFFLNELFLISPIDWNQSTWQSEDEEPNAKWMAFPTVVCHIDTGPFGDFSKLQNGRTGVDLLDWDVFSVAAPVHASGFTSVRLQQMRKSGWWRVVHEAFQRIHQPVFDRRQHSLRASVQLVEGK